MSDMIYRQAVIDTLNVGTELLRRVLDGTDIVGAEREKYEWGLELIECYISDMKELPSAQPEIVRCKDCRWGREVCGNIECFVDSNVPPEYHGYEWYCPNGERKTDNETDRPD